MNCRLVTPPHCNPNPIGTVNPNPNPSGRHAHNRQPKELHIRATGDFTPFSRRFHAVLTPFSRRFYAVFTPFGRRVDAILLQECTYSGQSTTVPPPNPILTLF